MTRPPSYLRLSLAMALGLGLFALAVLFVSSGAARALALLAAPPSDPARYCYSWWLQNETGQDADALTLNLQSVVTVSQVYTGSYNLFGPPAFSAYDSANDAYRLVFSGTAIAPGDAVLVGLCSAQQKAALAPSGAAWSAAGTPLQPAPLLLGLEWNWPRPQLLNLGLINSSSLTLTLLSVNLLDSGARLDLDNLNGDTAPSLAMVSDLLDGQVVQLPPGSTTYFPLAFDSNGAGYAPGHAPLLSPLHPYFLEAQFEPQNDPGNTRWVFSQALSPWAYIFLPVLSKK